MKKGVVHTKKDNSILALVTLFIFIGFLFAHQSSMSEVTGMFAKQESCKLFKDPFSKVQYCKGTNTNNYCVWNYQTKNCKFVNKLKICSKNNPKGFCSKPFDVCASPGISNICVRKQFLYN